MLLSPKQLCAIKNFLRLQTQRVNSAQMMSQTGLVDVVLVIFAAALCVRQSAALKINRPRSEVFSILGSNEGRIYFESCEQSQGKHACTLAMDDSYSQEPTQCALTQLEEQPYWEGLLEVPAYVIKVSVLNRDHSFRSYQDALTNMAVEVAGVTCAEYKSDDVFDKRLFPCDVVGTRVMIKSRLRNAELAVCEVDVEGVPLKFPQLLEPPNLLRLSSCRMSNDEQCIAGVDNQTSTCAVSSKSEEGKGYFVVNIKPPSIITRIHLATKSPAMLTINIDDRLCIQLKGDTNADLSVPLTCETNAHFGSAVQIISDIDEALSVCEIQLYGYPAEWNELDKMNSLGCFKNDPADLDLPQLVSSIRMTAKKCLNMCKRVGVKYFAVQEGRHCFCGSSFGKHGAAGSPSECNLACEGDDGQSAETFSCGGNGDLSSVYEIA